MRCAARGARVRSPSRPPPRGLGHVGRLPQAYKGPESVQRPVGADGLRRSLGLRLEFHIPAPRNVLKIGHSEFPGGGFRASGACAQAGALFRPRRNRRWEGGCHFRGAPGGAVQGRESPLRCRNRAARKLIVADFQHIDPLPAAGKYTLPDFQHILCVRRGSREARSCGRGAPWPCAVRARARVRARACVPGQNSPSLEGGITKNAPLWSKPAFTGGKSCGSAANSRPWGVLACGGRSKTPVQEPVPESVVKTSVICTYSEGQF